LGGGRRLRPGVGRGERDPSGSLSGASALFTELPRETVWKVQTGSISWSSEAAERDEKAPFWALSAAKKRAIRPARLLSRQSLEEVFSEVRRFLGDVGNFVPWSTYTRLRQEYGAFVT